MKNKKVIILIALLVISIILVFFLLFGRKKASVQDVSFSEKTTTIVTSTTQNKKEYLHDELQRLFIEINESASPTYILEYINKNNLYYSKHEYNDINNTGKTVVYKLAYAEKVSWQKHADDGDYFEIKFNQNNVLLSFEYFNENAYINNRKEVYFAGYDINNGYYGEYMESATKKGRIFYDNPETVINLVIDNTEK